MVANAVKHTSRGTVLLTARPLENDGGWKVSVIDSGTGIEPELLERIRECFRDPGSVKAGAGLGLSLAAQAARHIGAKLGAESTVGVGSRFWIGVPVGEAKAGKERD